MTLAAVMPLPEGLPELTFAGALGGRRVRLVAPATGGLPIAGRRRFRASPAPSTPTSCKPEGPVRRPPRLLQPGARLPGAARRARLPPARTRSGRSPSSAGRRRRTRPSAQLIHELTGPVIPTVLPGVHAVHAVDAAGVHPLLLAIGSERYVPYAARPPAAGAAHARQRHPRPGAAVAGQVPADRRRARTTRDLDIHDIAGVLPPPARARRLARRDLHFQTRTTIDTLDYSGTGLNEGSKLVIAAAGPPATRAVDRSPGGVRSFPGPSTPSASRYPASSPSRRRRSRATKRRCGRSRRWIGGCEKRWDSGRRRRLRRPCRRHGRVRGRRRFRSRRRPPRGPRSPRPLRRRGVHRRLARELPLGHLHPEQPVARRARRRRVRRAQALGVPRPARSSTRASSRTTRRRSRRTPRSSAGSSGWRRRAGRCTGSSERGAPRGIIRERVLKDRPLRGPARMRRLCSPSRAPGRRPRGGHTMSHSERRITSTPEQ